MSNIYKILLYLFYYKNNNKAIEVINTIIVDDILYQQDNNTLSNKEYAIYCEKLLKNILLVNKDINNLSDDEKYIFSQLLKKIKKINIKLLQCEIIFNTNIPYDKKYILEFSSEDEKKLFIELLIKNNIEFILVNNYDILEEKIKNQVTNIIQYFFTYNTCIYILSYIIKNDNNNAYIELSLPEKTTINYLKSNKKCYTKLLTQLTTNENLLLKQYINKDNNIEIKTFTSYEDKISFFEKIYSLINSKNFIQYIDKKIKELDFNIYYELISPHEQECLKNAILDISSANPKKYAILLNGPAGVGKSMTFNILDKFYILNNMKNTLEKNLPLKGKLDAIKLDEYSSYTYNGMNFSAQEFIGTGVKFFKEEESKWMQDLKKNKHVYILIDEADKIIFPNEKSNDYESGTLLLSLIDPNNPLLKKYRNKFIINMTTNLPSNKIDLNSPIGRRVHFVTYVPIPTQDNIKKLILNIIQNFIFNEEDENKKIIYSAILNVFNNHLIFNQIIDTIYIQQKNIFVKEKEMLIKNEKIILNTEADIKIFQEEKKNPQSIQYDEKNIGEMNKYLFGGIKIPSIYNALNILIEKIFIQLLTNNHTKSNFLEIINDNIKNNHLNINPIIYNSEKLNQFLIEDMKNWYKTFSQTFSKS